MELNLLKLSSKDIKILFVEDKELTRETFKNLLEKIFSNVETASDGIEGLNRYKEKRYDIVITDIDMPNMDGLEMSKKIKEIKEDQHIIIVSAYKSIDNYVDAIKIGVDGYILKPVQLEQIMKVLSKTVENINNKKFNKIYQENLKELVQKKTEEVKKQYKTDNFTGLKNKIALDKKLINNNRSLILCSIHNFNMIYNNFGADFCDKMIKKIASLLIEFESEEFELFKLKIDSFVFFTFNENKQDLKTFATKIKNKFSENTILVKNVELSIYFDIVIDSHENRDLLKSTNITLEKYKHSSNFHIRFYEENSKFEMLQQKNLNMIDKIRSLNLEDSVITYFQAIKNLKTKRITKYEVLGRIKSNNEEILQPNDFLTALKISGLITKFTRIIIDKSFDFFKDKDIEFSINLAKEDLEEDYLENYLLKKSNKSK